MLLVLFYVIGTLVGRAAGRKKALKSMAAQAEKAAPPEQADAAESIDTDQEAAAQEAATLEPPAAEAPAGKKAVETGDTPPAATDDAPAEAKDEGAAIAPKAPEDPSADILHKVSLDELLEDIRNM